MHAPAVHVAADGHALPHVPQFAGSFVKSTHAPGGPPHAVVPVGHARQTPLVHAAPVGQAVVHPPQCAGSLDGSMHDPLQMIFGDKQGPVSTGPVSTTVVSEVSGASPTLVSVGASPGFVSAGASPGLVSVVESPALVSIAESPTEESPFAVSSGTVLS